LKTTPKTPVPNEDMGSNDPLANLQPRPTVGRVYVRKNKEQRTNDNGAERERDRQQLM
jgi:hypothetical protein